MKITAYNRDHNIDLSGSVGVTSVTYASTHTALGSNTPLIESGAGAPGSGPQAAAWDHVHPAAGGASSFGSNSSRVAAASAAGASSSNSRADHVHDGIGTATASSSNTLNRGNLNLRAGTGIALGLSNTDGGSGFDTVTIENIASASGGGGGSVSYGSNSTRVSTTPAAGASALVSRADHVHDGISWTQDVDQPGASFSAWTAVGGTWSSNGTEIIQTNTSGLFYATYANIIALGWGVIMEFEAQIVSGASGRAGFGMLDASASNAGIVVYIQAGSGVVVELKGSSVQRTFTTTISTTTWYKIRFVVSSLWVSVYLGGTLLGNIRFSNLALDTDMDYPSLYVFNGSHKFRNIKAWTLSGGAPA